MDIPDELLLSDSIPIEALQSFFMIPIVSPSPHIFEAKTRRDSLCGAKLPRRGEDFGEKWGDFDWFKYGNW